ncbi:septum site-determining protein Ssd [uncultured Corynebacterium sp.]|uniref:septum site-determining protein Ssd n=1 Tax=uncultured Corynebacterium sp. TaxID=159447 RepID=UPI0025F9A303|nr:septum site-determining protein Ssd [uncultured Corynebacterium sp.]
MNAPITDFILIAVTDPLLIPEAQHAAAAASAEVRHAVDPREISRLAAQARAVVVDETTAAHVASLRGRAPAYFVGNEPGPLNYEAALNCHAEAAFILPAESRQLLETLGEVMRGPEEATAEHCLVAVVGAGGGAGASLLAAALARTAGQHRADGAVTLVDAGEFSGGLDLLLGLEQQPGARWPELRLGQGAIAGHELRAALPTTADGVAVLSAARSAVADPFRLELPAVEAASESVRGQAGISIFDCDWHLLPRQAQHVVVLAAAEVRSTAVAAQLVARLAADNRRCHLVVRDRGWSGLGLGEVEKICHADAVAQVPTSKKLAAAVEMGGLPQRLPRAIEATCRQILQAVGQDV